MGIHEQMTNEEKANPRLAGLEPLDQHRLAAQKNLELYVEGIQQSSSTQNISKSWSNFGDSNLYDHWQKEKKARAKSGKVPYESRKFIQMEHTSQQL